MTSVVASSNAMADVHPDCYDAKWGITCDKGRIEDVKALDALAAPVISRAGWARGCYQLQILKADATNPPVIMIVLLGPKGAPDPDCREKILPALSQAEAAEAQRGARDRQDAIKKVMKKGGDEG